MINLKRIADVLLDRFERGPEAPQVIFVVGAGASLESGMPLWSGVSDNVLARMGKVWGSKRAFLDEVYEALPHLVGHGHRPTGSDLEARILSKVRTDDLCDVAERTTVGRTAIRELIPEVFGGANLESPPQLAYELIAHFLKHGFGDHVISLNFDEVLDYSLRDELGADGFRIVLPDQQLGSVAPDRPHLIKLHGTVGQPESLRFTPTRTHVLSPSTRAALDTLVPSSRALSIISLGYSWADADLAGWMQSREDKLTEVLAIDYGGDAAGDLRKLLRDADGMRTSRRREAPPVRGVATGSRNLRHHNGRAATVDEILWTAWNDCKSRKPQTWVPSAARHLLLSHMFPPRGERKWPSVYSSCGITERCEAELFLSTAKGKGMITLSAIARDSRLEERLPALLRSSSAMRVRTTGFLRPAVEADVTDVLLFDGEDAAALLGWYSSNPRPRVGRGRRAQCWPEMIEVPQREHAGIHRNLMSYQSFFTHYLGKVHRGSSVEVDPGHDPRSRLLLPKGRPLPSMRSLKLATDDLVDSNWDSLLVVAESGTWLEGYGHLTQRGRTFVVAASLAGLADWTLAPVASGSVANSRRIELPWHQHNRHLTLAVRRGKLSSGIYFRRRQKTPRISPLSISDKAQNELRELLRIFLAYVLRSLDCLPFPWASKEAAEINAHAHEFVRELLNHVPLRQLARTRRGRLGRLRTLVVRLEDWWLTEGC